MDVSCLLIRQNMKPYFTKVTFFCVLLTLLIIIYSSIIDVINTKTIIATGKVVLNAGFLRQRKENRLKYILQWTSDSNVPFVDMGKGREGFVRRKCPHTNCFVTSNKSYLGDYTKFDVIAFAGTELSGLEMYYGIEKPERRSAHQKYVFASIEAADNYPMCTNTYDNFFNWTWTYKLNSEVQWGYIVIRDLQNNIIGPKKAMNWLKPDDMKPVTDDFKNTLKSKRKAAAWFASNCISLSGRENFVRELQMELRRYLCDGTSCDVDVYGDCGLLQCSKDHEIECDKNIEITYYFYLSFENAFNEDYVTEKLLRALNNNAVPIVYGGANYSRFMPDGAYLNAIELGVVKLAKKMYELINDPEEYASYFKWKNHYSYHKTIESVDTNEYCRFCAIMNDDKLVNEVSVYSNFREWWNNPNFICVEEI